MSDPAIATALLLGGFVLLMILRVPITYSLSSVALVTALFENSSHGNRSTDGPGRSFFLASRNPLFHHSRRDDGAGRHSPEADRTRQYLRGQDPRRFGHGQLRRLHVFWGHFRLGGGRRGIHRHDYHPHDEDEGYDEDFASPDGGKLHPGVTPPSLNMKIYSLRRAGCRWGDSFWRDIFPASRTALDDGNLLIIAKSATIP